MATKPLTSIDDLEKELLQLVRSVPAFATNGFAVFDVEDLDDQRSRAELPVVGVSYEGRVNSKPEGSNVSAGAALASIDVAQFAVIIAIQYRFSGENGDTRTQAHQLLDNTRRVIQGYKGVNTRPWRFVGEQPLPEPSGDGVVYYAQVWQTNLPSVGNFNQT